MKYKIIFKNREDGPQDSITIEGISIEDIRLQVGPEMAKRNGIALWAEKVEE